MVMTIDNWQQKSMIRRVYRWQCTRTRCASFLWSQGTSTISGWLLRAPTSSQSPTPWSNYRARFRACRSGRSQIVASETADGESGLCVPQRMYIAVFVVVSDDRCDTESLNDTAVPANSSRWTLLPPCCPDLHIGQRKRIQWCLFPIHSLIITRVSVLSSARSINL